MIQVVESRAVHPLDQRSFFWSLIGDGTPLLMFTGIALLLSGGFALFLSAMGHFLPHDIDFLGMTAQQLCGMNQCKVVHFMFHDRVSFGGALMAIGLLYLWLAKFPIQRGEGWAWWVYLLSCITGFASFLAYLGYGYLDTWHGVATLFLLPCVVLGLGLTYRNIIGRRHLNTLRGPAMRSAWNKRFGLGRGLLMAVALGMVGGGFTIMMVGITTVFVPQDIAFIGMSATEMDAINPKLVPLIAHDRAGFGGGVLTCGLIVLFSIWCGTPCRSLWEVLTIAGTIGFSTAIGVHPLIGYTDFLHLAPAVLGAIVFAIAMALLKEPMFHPHTIQRHDSRRENLQSTTEVV